MRNEKKESNDSAEEREIPYHEQVDAFSIDLDNLITRYQNEFDLTLETMIGCLEVTKTTLCDPMIMNLGCEMLDDAEEEEI
jgi:hypothetical protein